MSCSGDGHVRSKHGVVAHENVRIIHECKVEVRENKDTEMDMAACPVGMEGRLDVASFADLREHLLEESFLFFPSEGRVAL